MTHTLQPDWLQWKETQRLLAAFFAEPDAIRFVGGCVRDSLAGHAVVDIDLATLHHPDRTQKLLEQAGIKAIPTGIEHGTVTALIGEKKFEITTLRKDEYCDGRHAQVVFSQSWEEDAARRDFTINALSLSPAGELFDYHDGLSDLRAGCVRFIGQADLRIQEDYLRILRFFRFYARFGQGAADAQALHACQVWASHLSHLSGERIQQELFKLLDVPACVSAFELMRTHHILFHALGIEIFDCQVLARMEGLNFHVKFAALLYATAKPLAALERVVERLKLSNAMHRMLRVLLSHIEPLQQAEGERAQKQLLRKLGKEAFLELLALSEAVHENRQDKARTIAEHWDIPLLPIKGEDLIAAGYHQGKTLGRRMHQLEQEWEESDYTLSQQQLIARAKELL
ncbi:MAG: CCA tRNA nucleotidyltransferase [Rickettsiales bacterium]|nr:CCA tRNA nucleotidyltransferase [Rickettsiales bacterium]